MLNSFHSFQRTVFSLLVVYHILAKKPIIFCCFKKIFEISQLSNRHIRHKGAGLRIWPFFCFFRKHQKTKKLYLAVQTDPEFSSVCTVRPDRFSFHGPAVPLFGDGEAAPAISGYADGSMTERSPAGVRHWRRKPGKHFANWKRFRVTCVRSNR